MKKATEYGRKVKRTLPTLKKKYKPASPPDDLRSLEVLLVGVLREGASLEAALKALKLMHEEFVDFNEMRVAPPKDIVDLISRELPQARARAEQITLGLNRVFDQRNRLDFGHAADMGKRELQSHLRETLGFSPFVEAYLLLHLFDQRAVPVDDRLVERLKADGLVHPESDLHDVRTLLERVIPAKDQAAMSEVLAAYGGEPIKPSAKKKAKAARKKAAARSKSAKKTAKTKAAGKAPRKTTKTAGKVAKKKKTARKKTAAKKKAATKSARKKTKRK